MRAIWVLEATCRIGYPLLPYKYSVGFSSLVDTWAECTFLYRNPDKFPWPEASIDGYGGA